MPRTIDDVVKALPADRRARIERLARQKIEDMVSEAESLTDIRKALGKTQAEVAQQLGIGQNAVSQLERRSDTYVSTLRKFLKSLGMTLELSVVDKNGVRTALPRLLPQPDSNAPPPPSAPKKPLNKTPPARPRTRH